jgi:enoyl-CoA hydratase
MLLAADVRVGTEGAFRTGLNEVQIGLAVPRFVVELASRRLHPGHLPRAVMDAAIYTPTEAVAVGYYDEVVPADALRERSLEEAARLAQLDSAAYTETKQRMRSQALHAIRGAIESELTPEGLVGARAPA